ncbi:helix-turn-helix transcriptional regulator [Salinilacihabitans rarus]|uniref:helix-turn-helix transcriptional regulator n=1 Tax=Salinilacihabitans rarus TaxID=2961596 RepID=UPI0020C90D36|nr:MarR family transcriptional regulator [Salinilacihabitans rarus]
MNRNRTDLAAALVVGAVLLVGGVATWGAYRRWAALDETMGHMGGGAAMHGTHPAWYLLGTVLVASVVAGVYLVVRDQVVPAAPAGTGRTPREDESVDADDADAGRSSASSAAERVLDVLPDDERRIVEPVLESPGLTQIELRDRADFSKSKVSQTVTDLEKRGLLYREPQGRTYRIYPADRLEGRP